MAAETERRTILMINHDTWTAYQDKYAKRDSSPVKLVVRQGDGAVVDLAASLTFVQGNTGLNLCGIVF